MSLSCLVVDDNLADTEILCRLLRGMGVKTIETATSLMDAANIACTKHFDVMLLDLHLPDSSGVDTVSSARELAGLPVIVVTGVDLSDEQVHEVMCKGAMSILDKHTLNGNLRRAIQIVVSKKQIEREQEEYIRKRFAELDQLIRGAVVA